MTSDGQAANSPPPPSVPGPPPAPETSAAPPPRVPPKLGMPSPRVALVIAAAIVVGVVLYLGRSALTPFIIGALIVYLLDPPIGWLSRLRIAGRRMPRWLAVLIVYVITFFVIIEALALLVGPLVSQLLDYVRDLPSLLASLETMLAQIGEIYRSLDLPASVRQFIDEAIAGAMEGGAGLDFGSLLPVARTVLSTAAGFFGFLIIPIWAFYILRDRVRLTDQLQNSLPASWRDEVWSVLSIIERVFGRWIRAQVILGLIVGVMTYAGLLVLGLLVDERFLQFAILLAVIAGVLELLPIIGPIISMIPTLLIALITDDPVVAAVAVVILYLIVQQVENNVLVPIIQGDAVELHPSLVIFALIIGGSIAGLLGAILAIPITAAATQVYRYLFKRLGDDDEVEASPAPTEPAPASEEQPTAPTPQPDDASMPDPALSSRPEP